MEEGGTDGDDLLEKCEWTTRNAVIWLVDGILIAVPLLGMPITVSLNIEDVRPSVIGKA